jgi:hypothetical protein
VVVTWEHADLCTALNLPGDRGFPTALAVLDASLAADVSGHPARGHTLSWYPLRPAAWSVQRSWCAECAAAVAPTPVAPRRASATSVYPQATHTQQRTLNSTKEDAC